MLLLFCGMCFDYISVYSLPVSGLKMREIQHIPYCSCLRVNLVQVLSYSRSKALLQMDGWTDTKTEKINIIFSPLILFSELLKNKRLDYFMLSNNACYSCACVHACGMYALCEGWTLFCSLCMYTHSLFPPPVIN